MRFCDNTPIVRRNIMESLTLPVPKNVVSVAEFFRGKDIFVTGATGFMGKILVEKLLWSCEDIGNIYLLMRQRKGNDPRKRLNELIQLPAFERLRNRDPKVFTKLIPISGDITELNLGLSDEDRKLLESRVSVIFHVASSVRFDDPLKKAVMINVRGTRDILELAKNMKNLKVMTYISTSYCNTTESIIEEKVIPSEFDWRMMITLAEMDDENLLNVMTPKILGKRPNTYTFTKSLAENIVKDYSSGIPSIIFRPSIVTFSIKEPVPGWVDNLNGPVGLATGIISGVLHTLYGDADCLSDYVPLDYAINGIIVAGWYRGISDFKECQVINGASGNKKPVSIGKLYEFREECIGMFPPSHMLWYPSLKITKSKFVYYSIFLFTQLIPALLLDVVAKMKGYKFSLMKIYRKVFIANAALSYFMLHEWQIITTNYNRMSEFLIGNDKDNFDYDLEKVDVLESLCIGSKGMKKYILKDNMSETALNRAKFQFKTFYFVHHGFMIALSVMAIWFSSKLFFKYVLPIIE